MKMNETIRYFDCFAGIGGFRCAAEEIKREAYTLKHVSYCELDKQARSLYNATCDITGIQEIIDVKEAISKYSLRAEVESQLG